MGMSMMRGGKNPQEICHFGFKWWFGPFLVVLQRKNLSNLHKFEISQAAATLTLQQEIWWACLSLFDAQKFLMKPCWKEFAIFVETAVFGSFWPFFQKSFKMKLIGLYLLKRSTASQRLKRLTDLGVLSLHSPSPPPPNVFAVYFFNSVDFNAR